MTIAMNAALAATLLFPTLMILAALTDLTTMRIGNGLILLLLAGYAVLAPLAGLGFHEVGFSAAAAATVFFVAFGFFVMGWVGGGDAKLATVTALWLGADHVVVYLVYTALLGGGLTLGLLAFRRLLIPVSWYGKPWIARLHAGESGVPYGVALAAAALAVFPETNWMVVLTH